MSGLTLSLFTAQGATRSPGGTLHEIDFNQQIRPILSENCFLCHGPDASERKGGLRLDLREEALKPAKSGAIAIVPGHPEKSVLLTRVSHTDPDEIMPPPKTGKKVTAQQIELLRQWISEGARYAMHWSYAPPVRPELPSVKNPRWARNGVDRFILAKLEKEGLDPMPEADRATLIRRVALDLTGLPPTLEEAEEVLSDRRPDAYERWVDRVLSKPSYGEHWAQMWLDLARYADSAGYADDPLRTIWGYRDYVIRAFNENKPFDQFTLEQLAGDLLPNSDEERLVATAFHRNTMTNSEGGTNDEEFRNAAIIDRVNTTFAVWMGTSMACAQCHNHKYDPISQEDYFRVFAIFNNTEDADRFDEAPVLPFFTPEQKKERARIEGEMKTVQEVLSSVTAAWESQADQWADGFPRKAEWRALTGGDVSFQRQATWKSAGGGRDPRKEPATDTQLLTFALDDGLKSIAGLRLQVGEGDVGEEAQAAGTSVRISEISARIIPPASQRIQGRFVRVELPGADRILSLAEVQVFDGKENIALKGSASQSTTDEGGDAKLAIDGNTDGRYAVAKSTTHTRVSSNPWWELDLQSQRDIQRVVIWNRTDNEVSKRLAGYRVQVMDADRKVVWERVSKDIPSPSAEWSVDGSRTIPFVGAFDADELPQSERKNLTAWMESGAGNGNSTVGWMLRKPTGAAQELTLLPQTAIPVVPGSTLKVTIQSRSETWAFPLMNYRVLATDHSGFGAFAKHPPEVLRLLNRPHDQWTDADRHQIAKYYVASVAPELQPQRDRLAALKQEYDGIKPSSVPIYRELAGDKRRQSHVQYRGNYMSLGKEVKEAVPASFGALPEGMPPNRLAFAKWLTDARNPLCARVTVNRIWEQIFGIGIVRTSEEFGSQGEPPSNPVLLDWLSTELIAQKWDLKSFMKLLVTSSAYRQSSQVKPDRLEKDPDNRWLTRGPRFRLSAETIRDQALFVSGLLSRKMYGPSVKPLRPASGLSAAFGSSVDWKTSEGEDRFRRGLYTEWRRTSPYPSMTTFDAPNREVCTIRRNRTNTPLQALVTLNDPVFLQAAQALAKRMLQHPGSVEDQIRYGFRLCLIRPPSEAETRRLAEFLDKATESYRTNSEGADKTVSFSEAPGAASQNKVELAAWTALGNVLLNLDETLMKR